MDSAMPLMTPLDGALVRLRPLRPDDCQRSVLWRNDPEIRDNQLGYRFPVTVEMERNWVEQVLYDQSRSRCILAIEDRVDDQCIGFVYLQDIDWINRVAEFGISIGEKDRHGRGLAKEAMTLMINHAFSVFNLQRVWVRVASYNTAALGLYPSLGFVREGVLRHHVALGGTYHDVILFGLLGDDPWPVVSNKQKPPVT